MEGENKTISNGTERRSEPRSIVEQYSSLEFSIKDLSFLYQFKIRETSTSGISILINEGSELLKFLKVGDILDVKYYAQDLSEQPKYLETEIKHITKDDQGRFAGHCVVGLSIIN